MRFYYSATHKTQISSRFAFGSHHDLCDMCKVKHKAPWDMPGAIVTTNALPAPLTTLTQAGKTVLIRHFQWVFYPTLAVIELFSHVN